MEYRLSRVAEKKIKKNLAAVGSGGVPAIPRLWDGQLGPFISDRAVPNFVPTTKPYRVLPSVGQHLQGQEIPSLDSNSYHSVIFRVTY